MPYLTTFDTRVAGIPCQVGVLHFFHEAESRYCPGATEFEFRLLDRSGRVAPWLEAKLTPRDEDRLFELASDRMGDRA